jgi:mono/diheme cytochrome c family protein
MADRPAACDDRRGMLRAPRLLLAVAVVPLAPDVRAAEPDRLARGRELYTQGCQSCHGADGRGNPQWESAVRPVAFTDCGTTSEATETWATVVKKGGPSRGLDSAMPAFEGAYTDDELGEIIAFIRSFCPQAERYPPGDLNFRRLLRTGKAFPEQEVVLRASHRPDVATRETEIEVLYENRLGPTFQYELVLPWRTSTSVPGEGAGLGDIELEGKKVVYFSQARRDILSVGLGLGLPTGSEDDGLGSGTVAFTPFMAYGKAWGRSVLQLQAGAEIPADSDKADPELLYRIGVSHALGPVTTAFTPALELVGSYNTKTHEHDYAVWGELSKPLNKLGHVIASLGVQAPIRPQDASWKLELYLLWDFGDGSFWTGW